jgi:hypothetical protein
MEGPVAEAPTHPAGPSVTRAGPPPGDFPPGRGDWAKAFTSDFLLALRCEDASSSSVVVLAPLAPPVVGERVAGVDEVTQCFRELVAFFYDSFAEIMRRAGEFFSLQQEIYDSCVIRIGRTSMAS